MGSFNAVYHLFIPSCLTGCKTRNSLPALDIILNEKQKKLDMDITLNLPYYVKLNAVDLRTWIFLT